MVFVRPVIEKFYNIIKMNIEHIGVETVGDSTDKIGYGLWRHPSLKIAELRHYIGWGDNYIQLHVFDVRICLGDREHNLFHSMIKTENRRRDKIEKKQKKDQQESDEDIALSKLSDMIL